MGMLFTTQETTRLVNRLNRRFNDDNIDNIRGNTKRLKKFTDLNRTLPRIAYKSGTYPGAATTDDVAKRWFYFLLHLDPAIATQIKQHLKTGLTDTLMNGDYKYLSFSFVAYEGPCQHFDCEDVSQVDAGGTPTGYFIKIFKLQTPVAGQDKFDASTPDMGEAANEPDDPAA